MLFVVDIVASLFPCCLIYALILISVVPIMNAELGFSQSIFSFQASSLSGFGPEPERNLKRVIQVGNCLNLKESSDEPIAELTCSKIFFLDFLPFNFFIVFFSIVYTIV